MRTAAGRPLRVTTTRSWCVAARSTKSDRWSRTLRSGSVVIATIVPRGAAIRDTVLTRTDPPCTGRPGRPAGADAPGLDRPYSDFGFRLPSVPGSNTDL